jgi:hypothetical protein
MKNLIKYDFSRYTVAELVALTVRIIKNITNNPDFPDVQSEIPPLQQAEDDLKIANSNTQNGGLQQTQLVADKREALTVLLNTMATDVETACAGDRVKALGSGFEVTKETSIKKVMPVKVTDVEATTNIAGGAIDLSFAQEVNRVIYRIEKAAVIAGVAQPFTTAGYTTRLKYSVPALTAGVTYQLRVISINNLGESSPSDVATAMSL